MSDDVVTVLSPKQLTSLRHVQLARDAIKHVSSNTLMTDVANALEALTDAVEALALNTELPTKEQL